MGYFEISPLVKAASISITVVIWVFIYAPLAIYNSCKYYTRRKQVVYRARYANITIYEATFIITKIIFDCFDYSFYALNDSGTSLYTELFNIGNTFLNYLIIYCWIWRLWMISYQVIWTSCLMEHEWKHVINSSYLNKSEVKTFRDYRSIWYIRHKSTYGNRVYVKYRCLILVILSSIINTFCDLYSVIKYSGSSNVNVTMLYIIQLIGLIPMFVPYILLFIIYCITPSLFDNFYILLETKYIIICLFFDYFIGYIAYELYFAIYQPSPSSTQSHIIVSISFHIGVFSQFCGLMVSTWWVNNRISAIQNNKYYEQISRRATTTLFSDDNSRDIGDYDERLLHINPDYKYNLQINTTEFKNEIIIEHNEKKMKFLIFYKKTFEVFVHHLFSEFCIESMLSFIEFLQFQQYVITKIYINNNNENYEEKTQENALLSDIFIFHESVPKSEIVYDCKYDLRNKAYKLYKKYICDDAEYKINISYKTKYKLINLMNILNKIHINDWDLAKIFDDACHEMIASMNDSFNRFKLTPKYTKIVKSYPKIKDF